MFSPRLRRLVVDVLRFGTVGGVGFVVDIGLFNLLRATVLSGEHIPGAPVLAKAIAVTCAIGANWAGNRWWAFRDRRQSNVGREALLFIAASLAGSSVALLCLAISHYALHFTSLTADNISANVVGLALGSALRFFAVRRWVFPTLQLPVKVTA